MACAQTTPFDHLKEGKQVANRCSGSWLWQQERGFRHRINLICAPLSTGPSDGFLPLAWRLRWNHKSKETMLFKGEGVEKNRQWPAVMSLEQITSVPAAETGGNLPDRELRVRDIESQWWRRERDRRGGRTSFSGGQLHARAQMRGRATANYIQRPWNVSLLFVNFYVFKQFLVFVFIEETCWWSIKKAETLAL